MKNAFHKNIFRTIRHSLGRFVAIFAIIALGVGFFSGLRLAKPAMLLTGQDYLVEHNFYDFRLLSTWGFTEEEVEAILSLSYVTAAEGAVSEDFLYIDEDNNELCLTALSLTETVNTLALSAGTLPTTATECVVDAHAFSEDIIGKTITLATDNSADTLDAFSYTSYTVTGLVYSPIYLNLERGTTSLGTGKIDGYVYLLEEGFSYEYYEVLYLTIDTDALPFTSEYDDAVSAVSSQLESDLETILQDRYDDTTLEANDTLLDTLNEELCDQLEELQSTLLSIQEGIQSAIDAQQEAISRVQEEVLTQIKEAAIAQAKAEAAATLQDQLTELDAGLETIQAALLELQEQIATLEAAKETAQLILSTSQDEATLAAATIQLATISATLEQLQTAVAELTVQMEELTTARVELATLLFALTSDSDSDLSDLGLSGYDLSDYGLSDYDLSDYDLSDYDLSDYDLSDYDLSDYDLSSYDLSEYGLTDFDLESLGLTAENLSTFDVSTITIETLLDQDDSLSDEMKTYLSAAYEEYTKNGFLSTETLRSYPEMEELWEEVLEEIPTLTSYVLDRSTNSGYAGYESDISIVEGIAKIFPLFFFLIAALVCSTTMTRMIDEERGQLGSLRAMGYFKGAIYGKYLIYSGSAALLGAVTGYFLGAWLFPLAIWIAYGMIYGFSDLVLTHSATLFFVSLGVSLLCSAGTTFLACYRELSSTPAQLLRPKAPAAGKRIFLEHLTFLWNRLSFLHKVSARNVFRFKKRMIMMILGIGGCTALVLTGFGIQDSVSNIANYEYDEIMQYDIAATFTEALSQEETDRIMLDLFTDTDEASWALLQQISMTATANATSKSIYLLICEDDSIEDLVAFSDNGQTLSTPGPGEILIDSRLAKALSLSVGDTLTLEVDDTTEATLTVSGIFNNYIYYYAYLSAETYEATLGQDFSPKTLYLSLDSETDPYVIGTQLSSLENAASLTIVQDMRNRVDSMMDSMNFVVLLVIACAAALAFIVLFNLGNINISERVREIATLKVLGFYPAETSSYVFRENMVLSLMGILLGLPLGYLLHQFVMTQLIVEMVSFEDQIFLKSYGFTVLNVLAFTLFVDLILRRKIDKIPMAESLKSVE